MRREIKKKNGRTYYLRYYQDWLDFLSFAEHIQREGDVQSCSSLEEGDAQWYGTDSLATAIDMARRGWPDGRKKVQLFRDRLRVKNLLPTTQRMTPTFDVAGDDIDVDRYLMHEPEHMITLHDTMQSHHGKVIRFALSRSGLGYVDGDAMVRRGVALLIAIETLRLLGFTVEITIVFSSEKGSYQFEQYIPVLHAGDPVNRDTLAFMFLQPAVIRRLCFAAKECESEEIRSQLGFYRSGNYAKSCPPSFLPEHDFFCNWDEGLLNDDEEIIPFVKEVLRKVGVASIEQ